MPAAVADAVAFLLLECMMAFGDEEQEPIAVADVLHVGEATFLAVGALTVGLIDLVFCDQFAVD